jgi:hypothetical protein
MQVRFYFDPLCPWCWITSHWLHDEVTPHRAIEVDWRPISLKVRNEHKDLDPEYAKHRPGFERSFKLLRIVEALRAADLADTVHDVYVAFGRHFHHGETDDDGMTFDVGKALVEAGVDPAFADAYDDPRWDDAVRASTREAEDIAGDDVGTPVIAIERDGRWTGYFGPVIPTVVRGEDALRLWDGLAALMQTDGFFELKRTRDVALDLSTVDLG